MQCLDTKPGHDIIGDRNDLCGFTCVVANSSNIWQQRANVSRTEPELHRFFMQNTWRTHTGRTSTTVIYARVVRGRSNHQVEPVRTVNWQPQWIMVQCFRGPVVLATARFALLYALIVATTLTPTMRWSALVMWQRQPIGRSSVSPDSSCVERVPTVGYLKNKMVPGSSRKEEPDKGGWAFVCRNCRTDRVVFLEMCCSLIV